MSHKKCPTKIFKKELTVSVPQKMSNKCPKKMSNKPDVPKKCPTSLMSQIFCPTAKSVRLSGLNTPLCLQICQGLFQQNPGQAWSCIKPRNTAGEGRILKIVPKLAFIFENFSFKLKFVFYDFCVKRIASIEGVTTLPIIVYDKIFGLGENEASVLNDSINDIKGGTFFIDFVQNDPAEAKNG